MADFSTAPSPITQTFSSLSTEKEYRLSIPSYKGFPQVKWVFDPVQPFGDNMDPVLEANIRTKITLVGADTGATISCTDYDFATTGGMFVIRAIAYIGSATAALPAGYVDPTTLPADVGVAQFRLSFVPKAFPLVRVNVNFEVDAIGIYARTNSLELANVNDEWSIVVKSGTNVIAEHTVKDFKPVPGGSSSLGVRIPQQYGYDFTKYKVFHKLRNRLTGIAVEIPVENTSYFDTFANQTMYDKPLQYTGVVESFTAVPTYNGSAITSIDVTAKMKPGFLFEANTEAADFPTPETVEVSVNYSNVPSTTVSVPFTRVPGTQDITFTINASSFPPPSGLDQLKWDSLIPHCLFSVAFITAAPTYKRYTALTFRPTNDGLFGALENFNPGYFQELNLAMFDLGVRLPNNYIQKWVANKFPLKVTTDQATDTQYIYFKNGSVKHSTFNASTYTATGKLPFILSLKDRAICNTNAWDTILTGSHKIPTSLSLNVKVDGTIVDTVVARFVNHEILAQEPSATLSDVTYNLHYCVDELDVSKYPVGSQVVLEYDSTSTAVFSFGSYMKLKPYFTSPAFVVGTVEATTTDLKPALMNYSVDGALLRSTGTEPQTDGTVSGICNYAPVNVPLSVACLPLAEDLVWESTDPLTIVTQDPIRKNFAKVVLFKPGVHAVTVKSASLQGSSTVYIAAAWPATDKMFCESFVTGMADSVVEAALLPGTTFNNTTKFQAYLPNEAVNGKATINSIYTAVSRKNLKVIPSQGLAFNYDITAVTPIVVDSNPDASRPVATTHKLAYNFNARSKDDPETLYESVLYLADFEKKNVSYSATVSLGLPACGLICNFPSSNPAFTVNSTDTIYLCPSGGQGQSNPDYTVSLELTGTNGLTVSTTSPINGDYFSNMANAKNVTLSGTGKLTAVLKVKYLPWPELPEHIETYTWDVTANPAP